MTWMTRFLRLLAALEKHVESEGKVYQSPDQATERFYLDAAE